jgi:hypothetical protein
LIGLRFDHAATKALLDACLLTEEEFAEGPKAWDKLCSESVDPWAGLNILAQEDHDHDDEEGERKKKKKKKKSEKKKKIKDEKKKKSKKEKSSKKTKKNE